MDFDFADGHRPTATGHLQGDKAAFGSVAEDGKGGRGRRCAYDSTSCRACARALLALSISNPNLKRKEARKLIALYVHLDIGDGL